MRRRKARRPARQKQNIGSIAPDDFCQGVQQRLKDASKSSIEAIKIDRKFDIMQVEVFASTACHFFVDPSHDRRTRLTPIDEHLIKLECLHRSVASFLGVFVSRQHANGDRLRHLHGELLPAHLPGDTLAGSIASE